MKILVPFLIVLLFSCMPKPEVTELQRSQFEDCKKRLIERKTDFIATGKSESQRDSLKNYISELEHNDLDALLEKYEVPQEQLIVFLYSVCEKADRVDEGPSLQDVLIAADSLQKYMDSVIRADTVK